MNPFLCVIIITIGTLYLGSVALFSEYYKKLFKERNRKQKSIKAWIMPAVTILVVIGIIWAEISTYFQEKDKYDKSELNRIRLAEDVKEIRDGRTQDNVIWKLRYDTLMQNYDTLIYHYNLLNEPRVVVNRSSPYFKFGHLTNSQISNIRINENVNIVPQTKKKNKN